MTAQPAWSPVDDETASLLSLVAVGSLATDTADWEWSYFVNALQNSGAVDGVIYPNNFRRHVRGTVAPQRIGAFTNRALAQKLIEATGEWEVSDDREGRNAGRPARVYRWLGGAA